MMRPLKLALGLATAFVMACDGTGAPFAPDQSIGLEPLFSSTGAIQCETISFNEFSHADIVTSLTTGFGFALTVDVVEPNGVNTARIYDTQFQGGPDPDLEIPPAGYCTDCALLSDVMVIEGRPSWEVEGDSPDGGSIELTGFSGNGTFFIESYKALDQEDTEAPIRLLVDGTEVGASTAQGDGSVETVVTTPTTFDETAVFVFGGSGAVDDLVICRETPNLGRMTGGGVIRLNGEVDGVPVEVKFTHGFTLHCDNTLSNNLEINWGGNQWHIEKESLTNIECTDDPTVEPDPPPAPFDTFEANAVGRLNGEWGSAIWFKLQDAGEPGGKKDKAGLKIWAPGDVPSVDDPVVYVAYDFTENGNLQAHYDQPHGNKPNK